jgi:hypothetical protein
MVVLCELCECEAVLQCKVDGLLFCEDHGVSHLVRRPTHYFDKPTVSATEVDECVQHKGEAYVFYCQQDKVPVCRVCDRLNHHQHQVVTVEQGLDESRERFEKIAQDFETFYYDIRAHVDLAHKELSDVPKRKLHLEQCIEANFQKVVEILTKKKDELLEDLNKKCEDSERGLSEKVKKLEHAFEEAESLKKELETVDQRVAKAIFTFNSADKFLERKSDIEVLASLRHFLRYHPDEKVVNLGCIKFLETVSGDEKDIEMVAAPATSLFPPLVPGGLSIDENDGLMTMTTTVPEFLILSPKFNSGIHCWSVEFVEGPYLMVGLAKRDQVENGHIIMGHAGYSHRSACCLWYVNIHAPGYFNYGEIGQKIGNSDKNFTAKHGVAFTLKFDADSEVFSVINPETNEEFIICANIGKGLSPCFEFWNTGKYRVKMLN